MMVMGPEGSLLSALAGDAEIATLFSDAAELSALLRFESALAVAEAEHGLVAADAAARIEAVCAAFAPDWSDLRQGVATDGVVVPALVRQLRRAIGEPHGGALHLGATSQDAIDTSLMLRLAQVMDILEGRLSRLVEDLAALSKEQGATRLMAHTRMQRALPFTVADKIENWAAPLRRQLQQLSDIRSQVLVVQFGGPVGTRDTFHGEGDAIMASLARELGLGAAACWHAQRDRIGLFASWLSVTTGSVGKIGADICLMAQNELGEVLISGGGTSSAMPHKSNPVAAETMIALARFNAGLSGTLQQALIHENERSGSAWTLEWLILPQMVEAAASTLRLACDLIGCLSFKADLGSQG